MIIVTITVSITTVLSATTIPVITWDPCKALCQALQGLQGQIRWPARFLGHFSASQHPLTEAYCVPVHTRDKALTALLGGSLVNRPL